MVNTNKLRGAIAEKRLTQRYVATKMGIGMTTFYRKMKVGVFSSDEMYKLKNILELTNADAIAIFFASEDTCEVSHATSPISS